MDKVGQDALVPIMELDIKEQETVHCSCFLTHLWKLILNRFYSSLEVAAEYFRSGADKISIGSDAVYAAEEYLHTGVSLDVP